MFTTFNLVDDKTKITVINHRQLIESSYKDVNKNISYTLKSDIFNFNNKNIISKETTPKRKVKKNENNKDTETTKNNNNYENEFRIAVEELQKCIRKFLQTETNRQIFQQVISDTNNNFNLDSIINETNDFPRSKGANLSENLIKTTINNREYIIPPYSKFFNYNIKDINEIIFEDNKKFDLIILDPPWRNKYIRRLKKSKHKSSVAYDMLNNDCIKNIPISKLLTLNSLVVIWCTNSYQHQNAIINSFLPSWNLKLITKFYWIKMNINGATICNFNTEFGKKQPFELIFIACPENSQINFKELFGDKKNILMSIPSLINSHKPPLIEILRNYLPISKPNCLEIFARYLQPNFTSIGLEVLKLMDSRFYELKNNETDTGFT